MQTEPLPNRRALIRLALLAAVLSLHGVSAQSVDPGTQPERADAMPGRPVSAFYRQRVWTREHGLPHEDVRSLLQTRDGFLWIGTRRGLGRFDGRLMTQVRLATDDESLSGECTALAEDADGEVWVGTTAGLIRLAAGGIRRFTTADGLLDDRILALCGARSGDLWVATASGLNRRRSGRFEVMPVSKLDASRNPHALEIQALYEDAAGGVWFAGWSCVGRWDPKTDRVADVAVHQDAQIAMQITGDARTNVWLRSLQIYHHSPQGAMTRVPGINLSHRFSPELQAYENPGALLADHAGNLWVGWQASGLMCARDGQVVEFNRDDGLSDTRINCLLEDREGNLWIGTGAGGLNCWQPRRFTVYTSADGLLHDDTRTLCPARDGGVWIGTERGVSLWRKGQVVRRPIEPTLFDTRVRSLYEHTDGSLWIGTMDSLERWQDGELVSRRWGEAIDGDRVWVVMGDRAGALWVGHSRGLLRCRDDQWTHFTAADGLPHEDVHALLEDHAGRLWLGTLGAGLYAVAPNPPFRVLFALNATNGLSANRVWALHEDRQGVLWAGTDHGLNRIEFGSNPAKAASPAWKVAVFDIRHGLVDNRISAMVEDDLGHFWIGCQRGICRVSRTELDAVAAGRASQVQCVVYDEADGLRSAEVSGQRSQPTACKTSDGHLWFATAKGAVRFDPARVIQGDRPPPVAIDLVEVDDETRFRLVEASGSGSCLPLLRSDSGAIGMPRGFPTQPGSKRGRLGRLNVFCAAPTFRGSDRVRFRYRLEGWDTDWVQAGADRAARYTNLKPGTYRFRVRAATHFGLWNETGADLAFVVRVPFHETWWFTWACAGAVAGALGTAIRWHYRELKRVHAIERQYTLARERERIARDMHDNLGAGLTRLALLGERMARQSENPTIHDSAIRLADEATHLVDNLDGLVWAADPKHDRLADTLAFLREHAAMFLADAGIETRLVFPSHVPDHHMRGAVRRAVCLALEEALTNAIRHARASQITVTAHLPDAVPGLQQTSESPAFEITVTDNGRGFEMPCAGTPETPRTETGTECTTPVVPAGSIAVPVPSTPEPGTVHRGGPGGMGLPAMDARLRDCGGRLQVRSALGRGTTIVLRVPLDVVGG